jgi:hypothetical protein
MRLIWSWLEGCKGGGCGAEWSLVGIYDAVCK